MLPPLVPPGARVLLKKVKILEEAAARQTSAKSSSTGAVSRVPMDGTKSCGDVAKENTMRAARSELDVYSEAKARLCDARLGASSRIRRIVVPSLVVGFSLFNAGIVLRYMASPSLGVLPKETMSVWLLFIGLGMISMLLALVPTHARAIRVVTAGTTILSSVALALNMAVVCGNLQDPRSRVPVIKDLEGELPVWYVRTCTILDPMMNIGLVQFLVSCARLAWRPPPPRRHLGVLWKAIAGTFLCYSAHYCVVSSVHVAAGIAPLSDHIFGFADGAIFAVLAVLLAWPGLRVRVQAWLALHSCGASAATAVGALVSSMPLEDLMLSAKEHFRCVPLDRVTQAMMAGSKPDPELAAFSEPAVLGEVDAFVSHSWKDDADAKWAELQAWRQDFRAAMGREPRVWLDKFCIDQNDIKDSLSGLPIFLAGCDRLLVLHGETYQSRLWCLLEIFTFIVMGGPADNLEVRQLRTCGTDFNGFDARNATCTSESDRSHLLGIIETGLGTVHDFNTAVRTTLGDRLLTPLSAESAAPFEASPPTAAEEAARGGGESTAATVAEAAGSGREKESAPAAAEAACGAGSQVGGATVSWKEAAAGPEGLSGPADGDCGRRAAQGRVMRAAI